MAIRLVLLFIAALLPACVHAAIPVTELRYLSGKGPSTAVPWDFTVTEGRRSGVWSTIPVPSNWEQHGFGGYDYGESARKHAEHGLYRLRFNVPAAWQGKRIRLVFEGAMTETTVRINGELAGPTHVGGFYRFGYDITDLVKSGSNLLEADVAKRATDKLTDRAEGQGDYWMFGGIFRPVWLEAAPPASIEHSAINARADGTLSADVRLLGAPAGATVEGQVLDAAGKPVGKPFSAPAGSRLQAAFKAPRLWTAETPHLYSLRLTLRRGAQALHTSTRRFGFRSFEVRKGDGLYLNGRKIIIKGVNRHSFRPATARALDPENSWADARLIKAMNMNTARMSHYPPDPAFLEAADELGLYVINELSGWQHAHGTETGRKLVREMIERDVNHPSILFWANGNEGGFNRELDQDYAIHDPQQRPVIHPWELFGDIDTKHYPNWDLLTKRLQGPNLFMPTEFLHALYDGGGGASLDDYWKAMMASPYGVGGVIWALADEGIMRTDQNNRIDVFGSYAPDGIVGPRHEKDGSYHAVRQIWSPVQVDAPRMDTFDGRLKVHNLYDFTPLNAVRFEWRLVRQGAVLAKGALSGPALAPRSSGELDLRLPPDWRSKDAHVLELSAFGPGRQSLWTWTFATPALDRRVAGSAQGTRVEEEADGKLILKAGQASATIDGATGQLLQYRHGSRVAALANGPRLVYARPATGHPIAWLALAKEDPATGVRSLAAAQMANTIEVMPAFQKANAYAQYKLEISADGSHWRTLFDGPRRAVDGTAFHFAPQQVLALRVSAPVDANGIAVPVKEVRIGYAAGRFPQAAQAGTVSKGDGWVETSQADGLRKIRWTLQADGALRLDYNYALEGSFQYHGVSFDLPESRMQSMRWLGQGPHRVWQNRLQGTWLGLHDSPQPEFQGFYAGVRWAEVAGLKIDSTGQQGYLRVGTPRSSHMHTSVEFPAGDLSYLHAIPAIGSKFIQSDALGPSASAAVAQGEYGASLIFRLAD